MSEIICNACRSEIITNQWWNIAKDYEGNYLCDDCDMKVQLKEREGKAMKDYGFMVDEGGLICPKCADNPLYKGELSRVDQEGYPDGYTCDDCWEVIK